METRHRQVIILLAVLAVYMLPGWAPDPPLAQYIARGWLGVLLLFALWRGWRIGAAVFAVTAVFEGATSVCGALYPLSTAGFEGLCDKGTGMPLTLPVLTGALVALLATMRPNKLNKGR